MAIKDVFKSLTIKKSNETTQKNKDTNVLMASDQFPIFRAADIAMSQYKQIPMNGLAALGTAFLQMPDSARTITQTVIKSVDLKEKLFVGFNPNGVAGFMRDYGQGVSGNIMQINEQGKQVIAGRMRFKPIDNLPVAETTTAVVPFDPMTAVIAVALYNIDQKLTDLQKKAEEILQFLKLEKQSKQRGNLNMLAEIMDEYKRDCNNEKICALRVVAAQDIKREAHQDILFYQEQIGQSLQEQQKIHGSLKVQSLLENVLTAFYEYQLACYLYGFAAFAEVMLQKEFGSVHLDAVAGKMKEFAERYTLLYSECRSQIAEYQRSAIDIKLLSGIGSMARTAGEKLAAVPVLNKGTVDEALISAGKSLGKYNRDTVMKKLEQFEPLEDSRLHTFTKNLQMLNVISNHPNGLLMDGENLYVLTTE